MALKEFIKSFGHDAAREAGIKHDRVNGPRARKQNFDGAVGQADTEKNRGRGYSVPMPGKGVPWVHPMLAEAASSAKKAGAQANWEQRMRTSQPVRQTIGASAGKTTVTTVPTASNNVGYQAKHAGGGEKSTTANWESGTRGKRYKGKRGTGFASAKSKGYKGMHRMGEGSVNEKNAQVGHRRVATPDES